MATRSQNPLLEQNRKKADQNPGCATGVCVAIGVIFLLMGVVFLFAEMGGGSVIWLLLGVFLIRTGIRSGKAAGKQAPARPAPRPAAAPRADRPKPKAAEACPNPEPHRHYESAPRKREYDTFVQPAKQWPTAAERRRENMKNLYDAGLLTREEYDSELRRIQGS